MTRTQNPGVQANTPTTTAKVFKCANCQKTTFKSSQALEQHRKSAHNPAQCAVCKRHFLNTGALNQHKRMHQQCSAKPQEKQKQPAVAKKTPNVEYASQSLSSSHQLIPVIEGIVFPANSTNELPSIPLVPPGIIYKGHAFTALHPLEQQLMLKYLIARCHSLERLKKQGYLTTASTTMTGNPYPYRSCVRQTDFRESPRPIPIAEGFGQMKRQAVTIDCEMVQVARGQRELAFISVVDFLTGEVLINNYVQPQCKVTNWKSDISGVTPSAVDAAVAGGRALRGWKNARQALWEHISSDTILVGHSLNNDLSVLGIYHSKVFDSAIFTAEAVFPEFIRPTEGPKRLWSLKNLARDLLAGLDIQNSDNGHDCLEDTLTTREVVLFCLGNPEILKLWAEAARRQYDDEQMRKKSNKEKKPRRGGSYSFPPKYMESDTDDETEILRWEDIAEDCGWPHPDTGYDPWSD